MLGSQSGVLGKNSTKVKSGLQGFFWTLFPGVPQLGKHFFFMESMGRGAVV